MQNVTQHHLHDIPHNAINKLTLGGFAGYSSENSIVTGKNPPCHMVPSFPGTWHFQRIKLVSL